MRPFLFISVLSLLLAPAVWAGGSREFNGTNSYIDCGNPAVLNNLGSRTIVLWMNADGAGEAGYGRLLQKAGGTSGSAGWFFRVGGGGRFVFNHDTSGTSLRRESASDSWSSSSGFQAVAATWDGSTPASSVRIYVNGTEVAYGLTQNASGSFDDDSGHHLIIGNSDSGTARTFDGKLAHVQIFKGVLSESQITQAQNSPGSMTDGLVAYWPLTGSGSQEMDVSGAGSHCTVYNTAENPDGPPLGGDTTAPTGSITILAGAAVTATAVVTLDLSAMDDTGTVSDMQFSNDGTTYSASEPYASTASWTLSAGDGVKTVYARFADPSGNWSAPVTDTIELDTTPPALSGVSATSMTDADATIAWMTDEGADSVVEYGTTISYGQTVQDPEKVTSHQIQLNSLSASTTYYYRVKSTDAAGNFSTSPGDTFQTVGGADTTPPSNTSILINGGAAATNSTLVTLTLSATDPSGMGQMQFSNDGQSYSAPEPYGTSKADWQLTAGDGPKTVSARFSDAVGNWSNPVSDSIVLDTTVPSITITSPSNGEVIVP
ncbi:MAG TPA: LamG-like jellyroll fold domain-containing protein [Nitrospiraceae bacterium]